MTLTGVDAEDVAIGEGLAAFEKASASDAGRARARRTHRIVVLDLAKR